MLDHSTQTGRLLTCLRASVTGGTATRTALQVRSMPNARVPSEAAARPLPLSLLTHIIATHVVICPYGHPPLSTNQENRTVVLTISKTGSNNIAGTVVFHFAGQKSLPQAANANTLGVRCFLARGVIMTQ